MHRLLLLTFVVGCTTSAEPIETLDQPQTDQPTQTDPPEKLLPRISRLEWHWTGCGPQANAIPFGLRVDVTVISPTDHYVLKGQAVGCDAFDTSGQIRVCTGNPASPTRQLHVVVGMHDVVVPTVDCTDGKWIDE